MVADPVADYYSRIAGSYDESRFANSYGAFIHHQEQHILTRALAFVSSGRVLSLACGSGRFMEFADDGVDISAPMLSIAKNKWPEKSFYEADATSLPFPDECFDAVFCWHLCMHLTPEKVANIVGEVQRILRPGGRFVVDFPSRRRRQLMGHSARGWHGANSYDSAALNGLFAHGWRPMSFTGILFLPIHRMPVRLRPWLSRLDCLLTHSPLREFSSYLAVVVDKEASLAGNEAGE